MRNGLHASSSKKHAQAEIRLLFPDYEFDANRSTDLTPADETEHNDMARINPLFYHVFDYYHLEGDGRDPVIDGDVCVCRSVVEIIFEVSVDTQVNENETTDSAVFITVIGAEGETRPFLLRYSINTVDTLQSHQIDRFHAIDFDVGVAKAIRFSHDGRGFPKNWSVAYVEVAVSNRKKLFR
jgi:hypothetical protein